MDPEVVVVELNQVGMVLSVTLSSLRQGVLVDHNSPEASLSTPEDLSDIPIDSDTLKEAQIQDLELAPFFDKTVEDTDVMNFPICFYVKGGILMRKFRSHKFKNRLRTAIEHAMTNLKSAQCKMKEHFDLKSVTREFKPGDLVLAFLPIHKRPLQSRYHGPYVVEKKINEVNYVIKTPDRRKSERLIHINLLKAYYPRDNDIVSPVINLDLSNTSENNDQDHLFPSTEIKMQNSELFANPRSKFQHMTPQQEEDMECLLNEFPQLFGDVPLQCPLVKHDVVLVEGARPVKQSPYRTSPWKREALRKEVAFLLDHGLAERSTSEWASPCVLVDKPDGSFRMCTDYRQVNSLTRQDCYPLPRIDDLIDQLGGAKIISKIDLLRGYYQRQAAKGTKGASTIFWRTDGSRGGGGGAKPGGNGTVSNSQQSATGSTGRSDYKPPTNTKSSVVCAYCKSPDHHIRDCPKLKGKEKRPGHALATSTMSSTVPTSEPASCKPSTSQASSSFVMSVGQKETQDTNSAGCKPLSYSVDQFQPFRSRGMVSSSDSSLSHPIQILRDTGASHSLMLKGLVPDLDHCYLPQSVLIQGVGGCISVPLAKVYLDTDLAKDHNSPEASLSTPEDLSDIPIDSDTLKEAQIQDLELAPFFDKTVEDTDVMNFPICFYVKGGILMRKFRSHKFKNRLRTAIEHAMTNLKSAQCKMKEHFDLKSVTREFKPGDLVLAFLPIHKRPLQSRYHGPYVVEKKINEVNYVIKTPDRRKSERLIHINLLKAYYPRDNDIVSPVINLDLSNTSENNDQDHLFPSTEIKMQNSELFANPRSKFQHMTPQQEEDMECLLNEFPQLFGDVPLQCPLVKHDVVLVEGARPVKQSPYRTSPWKREALRKEVAFLLDHGLAERSTSEWASPCVLVDKPDGSFRMCTDYRQVNSLTRQDCYPLPRIDDLIDQLGGAKIISKIDLLRGYYQYQLGPPRINTSSVCLVE
ncbi:hypothetical protein Pmani_027583 [Petrolisthes manimaculis]|uniref:Peptidase A2 domain-containing protein n=1 Tax=Petrolisthes manimaculis TaxID=1843537 RepID=A0AAE1P3S3_9EUCA|nr:hypothetical protein Pmani_027583 [Petrolisthes manimaculis]